MPSLPATPTGLDKNTNVHDCQSLHYVSSMQAGNKFFVRNLRQVRDNSNLLQVLTKGKVHPKMITSFISCSVRGAESNDEGPTCMR